MTPDPAFRNAGFPAVLTVLALLAGGLLAGGGMSGEAVAADSLGSGLSNLIPEDDPKKADEKPKKAEKGKSEKQKKEKKGKKEKGESPRQGGPSEETPPGKVKKRARSSGESAPRGVKDGTVRVVEYEYEDVSSGEEYEVVSASGFVGIFDYERLDFALLARGGWFTRDLAAEGESGDGSVDFDAGKLWGLGAAILLRNEFGPELAFGLSYERLRTNTRVDLLSDGPLVMKPILLKGEYSNVLPGCRLLRFAVGLGLGLSLNDHELSKEAQAECAASGYACSEEIGPGFGVDLYAGPRYRMSRRLEGQAMFGLAASVQSAEFETVHLATGFVRRAKSTIEFSRLYASLGLRYIF